MKSLKTFHPDLGSPRLCPIACKTEKASTGANLREFGISFVSVGHRSTLREFHDHLIVLNKDGTAEISDISKQAIRGALASRQ